MLFLLFFLLCCFSAGNAQDDNSDYVPVVKNMSGDKFDLKLTNLSSSSLKTTTGDCSSFLICYNDEWPGTHGKLAKRFQLANYNATGKEPNERPCEQQQHWVDLSTDKKDKKKIRAEFSFGYRDIRFADLTLGDLEEDDAQVEGEFLDDHNCRKWLLIFAMELHLAENVNIWKKDCEWKFSNENGTTSKQPVIPTDGPDISPVFGSPEVSKVTTPSSSSTTSTITSSTTTTTVTTTTTEMPTTTKEPVEWAFDSEEGATFGTTSNEHHQYALFVRAIIEPWAQSVVLNMSVHGCRPMETEPDKCHELKFKPYTNLNLQFGVSFDQAGKAACWLKAIENSKLVDTGGFCNGSGLFKRGERIDLFFGMFNGDKNDDGIKDVPVNFNVKLGGIGIGEYTRPGLYTPIMGGYSAKLYGSVRPVPNVPNWALSTKNHEKLDEARLRIENLQIFGYIPLHSQNFRIEFYTTHIQYPYYLAYFHVDMNAKQVTIEYRQSTQTSDFVWAPEPFPSGFIAGENFIMSVVKKSCNEWWLWVITVNNVTFTFNANSGADWNPPTHIWAQFSKLKWFGDMVFYGHGYLPSTEANCVPTHMPLILPTLRPRTRAPKN